MHYQPLKRSFTTTQQQGERGLNPIIHNLYLLISTILSLYITVSTIWSVQRKQLPLLHHLQNMKSSLFFIGKIKAIRARIRPHTSSMDILGPHVELLSSFKNISLQDLHDTVSTAPEGINRCYTNSFVWTYKELLLFWMHT